jgi:predicted ester cyclase
MAGPRVTDTASELVDRLLGLWRRTPADDDEAVAAFAEVYTDPLTVNGAPMTVAGLVARARTVHAAYDDLELELLDLVTAPERVVIAFVMRARHTGPLVTPLGSVPPTGRVIAARTIDVLTMTGGVVSAITVVADELGVLTQLGAVRLAGN